MPSTTVFSTPSKDRHRLAFRTPFSALQVTDLNSQKPRQRAACPRQRLARTPTEASGEPEIAYGGGRDRTDTILATLACHEGLEPEAAIRWVREHYDAHAVETPWQRRWVRASRKGGEAR